MTFINETTYCSRTYRLDYKWK